MSTAELKRYLDERTTDERRWITSYLLDEMWSVPELRQTAEELADLARRRSDLSAGKNCVTQAEAEARWNAPAQGE